MKLVYKETTRVPIAKSMNYPGDVYNCFRDATKHLTSLVKSSDLMLGHAFRLYRGADKSLSRPRKKQGNVPVRMA